MITHEDPTVIDRVEQKYPLPGDCFDAVRRCAERYLPVYRYDGKHELWQIRTTYLDTPDLKCYQEYCDREPVRSKLRIRQYSSNGVYGNTCWVELKVKREGCSHKRRFMCHVPDVPRLLAGQDIADRVMECNGNHPHVIALYQMVRDRIVTQRMGPVVRIDYQRVSYQLPDDARHRLTVDRDIRCFTSGQSASPTLDTTLVELKFRDAAPDWLPSFLADLDGATDSCFSKYARAINELKLHKQARND